MRRAAGLVAVAVLFAAFQSPSLAKSTTVTLYVPPTQLLEGTSVQALSATSTVPGRLTIKSNIPWILRVELNVRGAARVAWRLLGTGGWEFLPPSGVALRGPKGIHNVQYELRLTPSAQSAEPPSAVVRFILASEE